MEVLLTIIVFIFALSFLLNMATEFIKQLKSGRSSKLTQGFEVKISFVPKKRTKKEKLAQKQTSQNDQDEG